MKNCVLKEMFLLSSLEKKARIVRFDRSRTLVMGDNGTGKSCLLKSIYWTLGAEPQIIHSSWKNAGVTSLVSLSIDGAEYHVMRHKNLFSLFDAAENCIGSYSSVTKELAPKLADLFDFRIVAMDRNDVLRPMLPAYLFLPYYIDQDSSWKANWSSFANLGQFPGFREQIADYHIGLRPNDYYQLKGEMTGIQGKIREHEKEISFLRMILTKLTEDLKSVPFTTDMDAFKEEIRDLLVACDELKQSQDDMKKKIVDLTNLKIRLESQIKLAERALGETRKDYKYLLEQDEDQHIACPSCGAEYENSFAERFAIAQDEDTCLSLLIQLKNDLIEVNRKLASENAAYGEVLTETKKIQELLQAKQGDVKLQDIIESQGRQEARKVLKKEKQEIGQTIFNHSESLRALESKLKQYDDKERKKEINKKYLALMSKYLMALNVHTLDEKSYKKASSKIKETGSALPRALLAYYFSILHLTREYGSSVFCPIIIDSPNQQAQDATNRKAILEFVSTHQPTGSQMILGSEDMIGVDWDGSVIKLTEKRSLLQESEFEEANERMRTFIEATIRS